MDQEDTKMENNMKDEVVGNNEDVSVVEDAPKNEKMENTKDVSNKKGFMVAAGIFAVAIVVLAFYYVQDQVVGDVSVQKEVVMATVNGESITQSEFNAVFERFKPQIRDQGILDNPEGLANVRAQILDGIINDTILVQNAKQKGISATQEEVDAEIQSIIGKIGGVDVFLSQLKLEGMTEDEFRKNLGSQLTIQKFIFSSLDLSSITVTDEETSFYYEQAVDGLDDVPAFDDVKDQVENQILLQKQQDMIKQFIIALRGSSSVNIMVQ